MDKFKKVPLKDYTNGELIEFLENNESAELSRLGGISSEILRRILNGELKINHSHPSRDP